MDGRADPLPPWNKRIHGNDSGPQIFNGRADPLPPWNKRIYGNDSGLTFDLVFAVEVEVVVLIVVVVVVQ